MPKSGKTKPPRGPIAAMYTSPGPAYSLPSLIGKKGHDPRSLYKRAPSFHFGARYGKYQDDCSPGPCYYPVEKRLGRQFSLYGRPKDIYESSCTPGPGAYMVEEHKSMRVKRAPTAAATLGSKKRSRSVDLTPGPNAYSPNLQGKQALGNKKSTPSFSISSRRRDPGETSTQTPGPGAYDVTRAVEFCHKKPPRVTMSGRTSLPGDSAMKPGPGAHDPERAFQKLHSAGSKSFGVRHSHYVGGFITDLDCGSLAL